MYRIAHISDLHIEAPDVATEKPTFLQSVVRFAAHTAEVDLVARHHDKAKLQALTTAVRALQPDVVVVTGDITNLGDPRSMKYADDELKTMVAQVPDGLLCVPGNHDTLAERIAYLQRGGGWTDRLRWWGVSLLARFVSLIDRPRYAARQLKGRLSQGGAMPFLGQYGLHFGDIDARRPKTVSMDWGTMLFFLLNSTNDSALMANEGRIGDAQLGALNSYLEEPANAALRKGVLVAVLHHHPISAPAASGSMVERAYDWMQDGPRLLEYLHQKGFHLVLHGHEHVPFECTVNYGDRRETGLHIVAAGSALQAKAATSFNVIDIVSPFWARLYRYDVVAGTGVNLDVPASSCRLGLRPLDTVRVSADGLEDTAADTALRNLVKGEDTLFDNTHEYELLDFRVRVTAEQDYAATYRRRGWARGSSKDDGLVFVLTGSPAMRLDHMAVKAEDLLKGRPLSWIPLADRPCRKVIKVLHQLEIDPNTPFDVSFSFHWQASAEEPNDFDGLNLMGLRYPVGRLRYQIALPARPRQPKVRAFGLEMIAPSAEESLSECPEGYAYSFTIEEPLRLAYFIDLRPDETGPGGHS